MPDIAQIVEKYKGQEERLEKRIEKLKADLETARTKLRAIKKVKRAAEQDLKKQSTKKR